MLSNTKRKLLEAGAARVCHTPACETKLAGASASTSSSRKTQNALLSLSSLSLLICARQMLASRQAGLLSECR